MSNKLDKSIFDFLKELKVNNNREWFAENKTAFKKEEAKAKHFFEALKTKILEFDEIENMKFYRIYRDVRFSADKTPYKTRFAASYTREGLHRRGGYYIHLEAGGSFLAGGFFDPNKEDLLRIRQELQMHADEMRSIMNKNLFKKTFGDFEGEELKTAPKGFDKEDPNIDLIRKKQFYFTRKYTDKEVLSEDFLSIAAGDFKLLLSFFDFMSLALTTNLDGEGII